MNGTMTGEWAENYATLNSATANGVERMSDADLAKLEAILYHWQQIMISEKSRRMKYAVAVRID